MQSESCDPMSDWNALYRQQDLEQRLAKLIKQAERDAPSMKAELQQARADAIVISQYFGEQMDTKLYNEQRPPHATDIASKAFAVHEIMGRILYELNHSVRAR